MTPLSFFLQSSMLSTDTGADKNDAASVPVGAPANSSWKTGLTCYRKSQSPPYTRPRVLSGP